MLNGYKIFNGVLDADFCDRLKSGCYEARDKLRNEISGEVQNKAGETGVIRIPMKFSRVFYEILQNELLKEIVREEMGEHAILHLQNAFILPPDNSGNVFQTRFHRDFPRYLSGFRASINVFIAVTEFTEKNGALRIVPGSHQTDKKLESQYLARYAEPVICNRGSFIVFDSTLYHCAGVNKSSSDRLGVNHQFTPHYIKPQMDYVRALGEDVFTVSPEVQKFLGMDSRVPASLSEYYQSPRIYKGGQG